MQFSLLSQTHNRQQVIGKESLLVSNTVRLKGKGFKYILYPFNIISGVIVDDVNLSGGNGNDILINTDIINVSDRSLIIGTQYADNFII